MSRKFIVIILGLFVLTGAAFFFVLHWGSQITIPSNDLPNIPAAPPAPVVPKDPKVTLTIEKSKDGNTLLIQWENLPNNTTALNIFRTVKGKSNWSLWKTITIGSGELGNGSAEINIGNATFSNYSFYTEAVTGGNGPGNGTSTSKGDTLWTSPPTDIIVPTSTPNPPPNGNTQGGGNQNGSSTNDNHVPPPPAPPAPPQSSSTPGSGNGGGTPPPQGTPYYNPQLQISSYGSDQSGSFWVQHVDQKIQIGWQSLPPDATSIVVYRSPNQDGPWITAVLTQENPDVNSAYSIQIVDDTLDQPYYYEMQALAESTTIATYGPVYLPPVEKPST